MAARNTSKNSQKPKEPTVVNRKARYDYVIEDTLECGLKLVGTEVKSVRNGQISLAEGYVRATETPLALELHGVHIAEYPPAGPHRQHSPTRVRILLAQARQIRKLADRALEKGVTLVPLKVYFVRGKAKLLVGIGRGKRRADKRQDLSKKEAKREMDRAMSRRR
ncbi:MAG: SsrA-binding protein SmpB [Planctomycetes bacterium]|nr:SsrA-binding protein SmpB [Planctomycetota bacterium]